MCAAPPVSPNYRMSNALGLRGESAYGGGIQSIRYRPSTPPPPFFLSLIMFPVLAHWMLAMALSRFFS